MPNIFVDFMKLGEHKNFNPQGTGLGLSICKLLVEKMRGHIDVKSKINVGTTFRIVISSTARLPDDLRFSSGGKFKPNRSLGHIQEHDKNDP